MIRTLITAAALALATTATSAAEFQYFDSFRGGDEGIILLTGEIELGDSDKLRAFKAANPGAGYVAFNSPGGLAYEGWQLGLAMSDMNLKSFVGVGHACLSACYSAFIGGSDYEIKGVLGAHVAWRMEEELEEGETASSVLHHGQLLGSYDAFYHLLNGFGFQLPFHIVNLTSHDTFLIFMDAEELNKYFARSDEDKVSEYLSAVDVEPRVVNASEIWDYVLENVRKHRPELLEEQ